MSKWKKKAKRNKKLAKYWMLKATALEADKASLETGWANRDIGWEKLYKEAQAALKKADEEYGFERSMFLKEKNDLENEIATLKASSTGDQSEYIKSLQDQINMLLEQIDYLENHTEGLTQLIQEKEPHTPEGRSEQSERSGATKWLKTPEEIEELVKEGFVWKATDEDGTVIMFQKLPFMDWDAGRGIWGTDNSFCIVGENDFSKPWKESLEYLGPKEKAPEGAPHVQT